MKLFTILSAADDSFIRAGSVINPADAELQAGPGEVVMLDVRVDPKKERARRVKGKLVVEAIPAAEIAQAEADREAQHVAAAEAADPGVLVSDLLAVLKLKGITITPADLAQVKQARKDSKVGVVKGA